MLKASPLVLDDYREERKRKKNLEELRFFRFFFFIFLAPFLKVKLWSFRPE